MLHFLFPKECFVCNKIGEWLCNKCKKKLVNTLPNCYICKTLSNNYCTHKNCIQEKHAFSKIITLWKYNEYGKHIIHTYKYKNRFKVGDYMFSLFEDKLKNLQLKDSVLIPLPSHRYKVLERGFNPTENIAQLIAEKLKLQLENDLIHKVGNNLNQASLQYEDRITNVNNIFKINERRISEIQQAQQIVIIDDIITTGSTLNEIHKTLRTFLNKNIEISALCIFQGNFKKNESKKPIQPNKEQKEEV